jgi:hypothetical protein
MLENLILDSYQGQPVLACADTYLSCVGNNDQKEGPQAVGPKNIDKAKLQVVLAVKPNLRQNIRFAAEDGYFDPHHDAFKPLLDFLQQM